jgi:hypothetical protein
MHVVFAIAAMLATLVFSSAAHAQYRPEETYGQCLMQARSEYRECLHETHSAWQCDRIHRREKESCWEMLGELKRNEQRYQGFGGASPRYEWVPIPQRQPFVLPGMR